MEQMEIIWLALMAVLLIIEIMTLGLTTIWFAAGALVATIAAACGAPVLVQVILFLVVSVLMLVFTRPVAMRYFNVESGNPDWRFCSCICCTAVFHKTMGCEVSEYQNGQDEYGGLGWQISQSHCGYQ